MSTGLDTIPSLRSGQQDDHRAPPCARCSHGHRAGATENDGQARPAIVRAGRADRRWLRGGRRGNPCAISRPLRRCPQAVFAPRDATRRSGASRPTGGGLAHPARIFRHAATGGSHLPPRKPRLHRKRKQDAPTAVAAPRQEECRWPLSIEATVARSSISSRSLCSLRWCWSSWPGQAANSVQWVLARSSARALWRREHVATGWDIER